MAGDYQTSERMALKQKAIPLPDLEGKSVLDVGCDHGHWCWLAAKAGATKVLGVDRGRSVNGNFIDIIAGNKRRSESLKLDCEFKYLNLGKQWHSLGKFDVTLCMSMYHHAYENCGDHSAVWFWLWRHTKEQLLWENPTGEDDPVVRMNVSQPYRREEILKAAQVYFDVEHIGPALHVKTREVWRCTPKVLAQRQWTGKLTSGGGGATLAFCHADNRRGAEIATILGEWPFPGTLNVRLDARFDWDSGYFRSQILETPDRSNLNVEWQPRWVRFYPVTVNGIEAHAIRFEGESYPLNYIEFIAGGRLRDKISDTVNVRS